MIGILFGFAPWIVYWILQGAGNWTNAVIVGGLFALVLMVYRLWKRNVKAMEAVTFGYFAVAAIASFGSTVFRTNGAALVNLTLAVMAFGTLIAKSPFTYQYARESWDRSYWDTPRFRRTNEIITAVWGVIFLVATVLAAAIGVWPSAKLWLVTLPPILGSLLGIVFSMKFPQWSARQSIARAIAARDPWPSPEFDPARPAGANEHDVIVIGAGLGGLSAGALLAKRGLKVIVFEQHILPGGYCTAWERGVRKGNDRLRYVFDAGVHDVSGLGEHGPTHNLLKQLEIADRLDWRRMDHQYITNEVTIKVPRDAHEFAARLGERLPAEGENIAAFFNEMEFFYRELYADVDKTGGVPGEPSTIEDTLAYPRLHPHVFRWMNVPFGQMLDHYFKDPEVKHFLITLSGYLSSDPSDLTVTSMAPIFGYYFDGGYHPAGSTQVLPDALVDVIRQHGGEVRLRAAVQKILVQDGRAAGVMLVNGETHTARAIISNADAKRTFLKMIDRRELPEDFTKRIESFEPSTSAFVVFLGINFVPDIEPVTIIRKVVGKGLGIMFPSKVDPSLAPPGHASLVLTRLIAQPEAATWDRAGPRYSARKHALADEMIATAAEVIPGLREGIVYRQEGSPATMERYDWSPDGAIYGMKKGQQLPTKSPIIDLFLAGAGALPGPGAEGAIISGTRAANSIYPAREHSLEHGS